MNIKHFVKDRDKALLSLNKKRIETYAKKYEIPLPTDEKVFWSGIHKAILNINSATKEQKDNSGKWLRENNFSAY